MVSKVRSMIGKDRLLIAGTTCECKTKWKTRIYERFLIRTFLKRTYYIVHPFRETCTKTVQYETWRKNTHQSHEPKTLLQLTTSINFPFVNEAYDIITSRTELVLRKAAEFGILGSKLLYQSDRTKRNRPEYPAVLIRKLICKMSHVSVSLLHHHFKLKIYNPRIIFLRSR